MATNSVGRKQHQLQALKYNMRSTLDLTLEGLYGPKAQLVENLPEKDRPKGDLEDPSCEHHLHWTQAPDMVLFMKKFRDDEVTVKFKDMARWMIMEKGLTVCCEPAVMDEPLIISDDFKDVRDKLITWEDDTKAECLESIDLIVCIGGDGTLLYTSSMFQESIPPIISFNMGSLGFLTPFDTESYKEDMTRVLEGRVSLTLRHRLVCEIDRSNGSTNGTSDPSKTRLPSDPNRDCLLSPDSAKPRKPNKFSSKLVISTEDLKMKMLVLNDLVVDRGPSPYLTNLELRCNDRPMTSVQGDGVIIATPTGSTAYSLAAGASMVHPSVSCMVVTPICPHSLSFRSIVVPAGVEISLKVAEESRNSAWVAFDGRNRQEIMPGDSVVVSTSPWPIPSINNTGHVTDWFDSLAECLHWNVRKKQKELKSDKM